MSERLQLVQIDCDGCGIACLEYREHRRDEAFEECGWVQIPDKAWHLCPVCRPDSPFEAVKRVRTLAGHAMSVVSRGCTCSGDDCTGKCRRGEPMGWDLDPAEVLRTLEGDSDEPAGP